VGPYLTLLGGIGFEEENLRWCERVLAVLAGRTRPEPAPSPSRTAYAEPMFSPEGPRLPDLAVQALPSVEHGYDLLAPKFDHTPFRTPDPLLRATASALRRTGPYGRGLDLCCGTGAGVD